MSMENQCEKFGEDDGMINRNIPEPSFLFDNVRYISLYVFTFILKKRRTGMLVLRDVE